MANETVVPDLYELAFMPGQFRCPKCEFQLTKRSMNMALGQIGTTEKECESEPCPNDGTMMVHVTYKEAWEYYAEEYRKLCQSGIGRIFGERNRQMNAEGWTAEHDDEHALGELALAAVAYASPFPVKVKGPVMLPGHFFSTEVWRDPWPWDEDCDKRKKHSRIRQLEIAGALVAAEIDRLERLEATSAEQPRSTSEGG
jgi:hypothetical protein